MINQPMRYGGTMAMRSQRGITLIVAMILLLVISVTAAVVARGSVSGEQISNNARSQELAWQAAEAALRYCEVGVSNQQSVVLNPTKTLSITQYTLTIAVAPSGSSLPLWATTTNWDASTPNANLIAVPLHRLDDPSSTSATSGVAKKDARFQAIYLRAPECFAQYESNSTEGQRQIRVTARGFGPEVANDTGKPKGSEVFLQSILDFN